MAAGTTADAEKLERLHRDLLTDPTLQFQFERTEAPQPPPDWLRALAELLANIAPFFSYIFWGGIAVLAALIVYAIVREIVRRLPQTADEAKAEEEVPVPTYRPATARARALLEEADRLAAEGRFGEAVRVLLHRSIEDMEKVYPTAIVPSMTSREISAIEYLSAQGRTTFVKIAQAVERSLFAGRPLTQDNYADCRSAYESFALEAPAA
ncbi:MAG: hypothetical protein HOP13_00950 [Alphaproteobacteria bacterium]|nr:hypothetical protein [Alphaproteobacteria bacterium]